MTLTFQNEQDGILLRDFLRRRQVSASLCAAVKRCGGFFADGAPVRANQCLAAGQTVSFALPPEPPTAVRPQDLPLCIVYEDEHLMVLEKPAGQTVHPTRGYEDGTLANAFLGEMRRRGAQALFRPVNRLDREASGLVLCAMNAWAAPILAAGARKEYLALAQGELPPGPACSPSPSALRRGPSSGGAAGRTAGPAAPSTRCWKARAASAWPGASPSPAAPTRSASTSPTRATRC